MKAGNKWKIVAALIFVVVVLNWGTISDLWKNNTNMITGSVAEDTKIVLEEESVAPHVYFCPRDKCDEELLLWLEAADSYIHCAFFELELESVKEKLVEMSESGVDVKVIVDSNYIEKLDDIDFAKDDGRSAYMHHKFCVLDGKAVWTGSFNPTEEGRDKNNNNVVFYQSQLLSANYETEFQEMWNGTFGKGPRTENPEIITDGIKIETYFCPEDWCGNKLIYALQDAKSSIHFMTFSFTHKEVGKQVLEMHDKGVEVQGVFEKFTNRKYSFYDPLLDAGIDVRFDGNPARMHHKVFIIDNRTVVTGSWNPSENAEKSNDENLIIIHDPDVAAAYLEEWEMVWEEAPAQE